MGDMEDQREEAVTEDILDGGSECPYVVPGSRDEEYHISLQVVLSS